jgi:DNA-binding transcriptional MocR family regulator
MPATGLEQLPDPIPSAQMTLVEQLTEWARLRIDERVFRAGMRMPSIRQLATEKSISRFTVVEAYERLVALGYLESRRGSGFYVRERTPLASTVAPPATPRSATSMSPGCCAACSIRPRATRRPAGASCPTNGWTASWCRARCAAWAVSPAAISWSAARRRVSAAAAAAAHAARRTGDRRHAGPDRDDFGITQAFDLIARQFLQPGDTVVVGDPAWFVMFARFATQGANVIGVPYTVEGPDVEALERIVAGPPAEAAGGQLRAAQPDRDVAVRRPRFPAAATGRTVRFHDRRG